MYKVFLVTALLVSACTKSSASEQATNSQNNVEVKSKASVEKLQAMAPQQSAVLPKKNAPLKLTALLISLLRVQDQIARGDHAALKLQKHLMKLLDSSIAEYGADWNITPAQFRALVIFGVVGTGSDSVVGALSQVDEPRSEAQLARAIVFYRKRQRERATTEFNKIKLEKLDARLLPFVAFARGNLMTGRLPHRAIASYDIVRLTAPGTLLEETSLRRLMMLYASQKNGEKFTDVAKQYARRFIHSPYRNQYLKMLQTGIFSMRQTISLEDVGVLGDLMPADFAIAFHMHLLQKAVVSGFIKSAEFSIAQISVLLQENPGIKLDQTKLALLKILSRMRNDDPVALLTELETFDPTKLSANDRDLYAAATEILETILSPVNEKVGDTKTKKKAESKDKPSYKIEEVSSAPIQQDKMPTAGTEDSIEGFIGRTQERLSQIDGMLSN